MKTTKMILAAIAATAAINLAALAGDLTPVLVANGHGQATLLYRSTEPSIALFVEGRAVASNPSAAALTTVSRDNGHGQSTIVYRAAQ